MTNANISNFAGNNEALGLWQYDQAVNLLSLLGKWNVFAKKSTESFWDDFRSCVLNIDTADSFGLNLWGRAMGIVRPMVKIGSGTPVAISDDLFRRLLKAKFYLLCHAPTIPNYNRYLEILFPDFANPLSPMVIDDPTGQVARYKARNRVLDFSNLTDTASSGVLDMAMGFTFPSDATDEEAYLIFQHYDMVYSFPAGICTHNSFTRTNRTIGFDSQNLNNFADGFYFAEDTSANGGILSGTEKSNYFDNPSISGTVFMIEVTSTSTSRTVTMTNTNEVWIDWGDNDFNYHSGATAYSNVYAENGLYAVAVYHPTTNLPTMSSTIKTYEVK